MSGEDEQEEISEQNQGDERMDKEAQDIRSGVYIQDGQCQVEGSLSVLWSDRQHKRGKKLSCPNQMAVVQMAKPQKPTKKLYNRDIL